MNGSFNQDRLDFVQIGVCFPGAALVANATRYPCLQRTRSPYPVVLQPPRLVEVLLLVWGVFFIATVNATPEQQARNFDKPIQMGKGLMRMKRPSPPPAVDSDAADGSEQQPNWDVAHGGPLQATGNSNGGTVSAK